MIKINPKTDALIIVDPQNDFCPGGALAVPGGDEVMPIINKIADLFEVVVVTQDWHPADQISFASNHDGGAPFSVAEVAYGKQVLWPDHCVQGTPGANFHPALEVNASVVIRKGANPTVDSYSAFFENDGQTSTGLGGYLKDRKITRIFVVGLAYDFCVGYSALDGHDRHGLIGFVVKDATRAIDLNGSVADIEGSFDKSGVRVITTQEIE